MGFLLNYKLLKREKLWTIWFLLDPRIICLERKADRGWRLCCFLVNTHGHIVNVYILNSVELNLYYGDSGQLNAPHRYRSYRDHDLVQTLDSAVGASVDYRRLGPAYVTLYKLQLGHSVRKNLDLANRITRFICKWSVTFVSFLL